MWVWSGIYGHPPVALHFASKLWQFGGEENKHYLKLFWVPDVQRVFLCFGPPKDTRACEAPRVVGFHAARYGQGELAKFMLGGNTWRS